MQKIFTIILLSGLVSIHSAHPQKQWSRPIRTSQSQLIRERRQFPFGEWIPLSQACPTCRPFADPLDVGFRGENIGLTPPRPPTVTRQIHGEGNFFNQDESSILSVPPPPPSTIPRLPNGNFQFSSFGQQFNSPLPVPTQSFPQTQQIQFLPQTFLPNQQVLVNGNQQVLPNLNAQNNLFTQQNQQINTGKVTNFNGEFKTQKLPENIVIEQNKRPAGAKQVFSNKPQPFSLPQQSQQQTFIQQQSFGAQQQNSVNFANSILTPPPAPTNISQDVVIPGLDKEEIQLLYVPVETLRQRGTPQEQLLTQQQLTQQQLTQQQITQQQITQQQPQNIQFITRGNGVQRPVNNIQPTEQTLINSGKGHFVTQTGNSQGPTESSLKVTSSQPFSTSVTPSTLLFQHLPFQQTPQPFVSATPSTPTVQPFVTPSPAFQKFSSFAPETTLPHLSTVPNTIQFSQSGVEFGTTPKSVLNQEGFTEQVITGKSQFSELKGSGINQGQGVIQSFGQSVGVTQQPQLTTVFPQQQTQTQFSHQINQQQIALQKQQEQQRLLQRQKEIEEQRIAEQKRKQKELEEQSLLQQQRQKELEQQRYIQKQKELEEQQLLQQRQKELEEQRLLQQRQKELEQQKYLQKQKELEEQKLLQQRQKELQQQKFLQEQRQRELEKQKRLQLQKQEELEEKRRLLQKQKEDEQRLLRFQQQQKELQQQRLLQQQQEEEEEKRRLQQKIKEDEQRLLRFQQQQRELKQQRLLQQQREEQELLEKQKQDELKKLQQYQFYQQQLKLQQQQRQGVPQQEVQQSSKHVLPANDNLNLIPQLEKETVTENQLVPHQPPLSVFYKGAEARITDVLRELRSSNTITVLDQYFDQMPKVFVGPAGLIPPVGYGKFDLPYLSNIESNNFENQIDKLPFFVAPLNFEPPPGYAKIPFPSPHVGSVVVSSVSNPAMAVKTVEKGSVEEDTSYQVVGPELPGLINNLETETTTVKPTTPSLPQTTAQLRGRRPSNSLYKPQNRKPLTRTRTTTTSRPEEEVTQPIQKVEVTKDSDSGVRKPFNRYVPRRRPQIKTTTEGPSKDKDRKSLENRHYSVEIYHQDGNKIPRTQEKNDVIQGSQNEEQFSQNFRHGGGSIDRITPSGHGVFEVRPTPDYSQVSQSSESDERRQDVSDYSDVNLQSFEDGPLPTGSAKTITQELYRPNAINIAQNINSDTLSKPERAQSSVKYESGIYQTVNQRKLAQPSDVPSTAESYSDTVSEQQYSVQPTSEIGSERQEYFNKFDTTELPATRVSLTENPISVEPQTQSYINSNEQYTSAFAEISKPHHIPGYVDPSKTQFSQFSGVSPTGAISVDLQTPITQNQQSQEYDGSNENKSSQNSGEYTNQQYSHTGSSNEQYSSSFEQQGQTQQLSDVSASQVSPTVPGSAERQYQSSFVVSKQGQNSAEVNRNSEDQRIGSFISINNAQSTPVYSQQYFPSSTLASVQEVGVKTEGNSRYQILVGQNQPQVSSTPGSIAEVTINPSVQTFTSSGVSESSALINEQTSEGHSQNDNFSGDHRLKLPNPSIVKVRTRVRGKPRGQVNFAASQSTTPAPYTRSRLENKHNENSEPEQTTRVNQYRDYNPVKISKFRGVKKPLRTTTEAPAENEQKPNVYTIRPPRRPLNPSTVSTKRIRRPTTPIPSVESETEVYGFSTVTPHVQSQYSQSEHDISPSGVSNDVYYEQASLSSIKHKFRKPFGSAEQKNDVVPVYVSTAPTYSTQAQEEYNEESFGSKELTQTAAPVDAADAYPEWNPPESGFDVSGIVLTTVKAPEKEEEVEVEEPKKTLDTKKAFDPDLEKKTGRRRIRVRVHKRPHENFETAESQNLRTVANVLVPPTSTYKPNDESSFQQLAKNADFSFGTQKLFGGRSREYFRKRLNITQTEAASAEQPTANAETEEKVNVAGEAGGRPRLSFVRKSEKSQKNDYEVTGPSGEGSETVKAGRPKFRGYVRKIVKSGNKDGDSESNQVQENEEHSEAQFKQPFRYQGGFNHTGRVNGTRHKTFVRYVKKNKVKIDTQEHNLKDQSSEVNTQPPKAEEASVEAEVQGESEERINPIHQTEPVESNEAETTEQPTQTAQEQTEVQENLSQVREDASQSSITQSGGVYIPQRPKFFQTLRPAFPRPQQKAKEPEVSTTERTVFEPQEKRNGFARLKYGKTTGFSSTTTTTKTDDSRRLNEEQTKNKNLHTLEVRKYLRTKNREGAFSQFSKNKYFSSEKIESASEENSEEITTEEVQTSSAEPKTTEVFDAHTEVETETTEHNEEPQITTTEALPEEITHVETTTEAEISTTIARQTPETKTTTEKVEIDQTEYQPDIYRFSKHSFNFETEKFTGTKNRAHVRNITTDIIENTASFSAPGVEKRPEIQIVTHRADEGFSTVTEKTEAPTTEFVTTTEYPQTPETETTVSTEAVTQDKVAKVLKTSTTTKVSHETEICYRGKCIRTKSDTADDDLKRLVDSAVTMKIAKRKTS